MPRWARFLSCSFTGLLLSLAGFLTVAYWWEGGQGYWSRLFDFLGQPEFWYLLSLFGINAALSLVLARMVVNLYGLVDGVAGFLAGAVVAAAYAAFLLSSHAAQWGGLAVSLQRAWPAGALFAAPFALSGALTTWMWDRLD